MWITAKRILRRLSVVLGFAVILVAIAIGAFRMVAAQLPTYKDNVQAWVRAELDVLVDYAALDLRLTLTGPQLQFYGVTLASNDPDEPFVLARAVDITLDPFDLALDRRFTPTRLTFEGIEITIVRAPTGELRIAGVPGEPGVQSFDFEIPRDVTLDIRDSRVTYEDPALGIGWAFEDVAVTVEQAGDSVEMSVTATGPPALASRVEASIDGELGAAPGLSEDWRAFAAVRDADLAVLSALWPRAALAAGRGDVSVWLETDAGELTSVLTDLALVDVAVDESAAGRYDRLSLTSEWSRSPGGWTLALNDVVLARNGLEWARRGNTVIEWSNMNGPVELRTDFLRLEDVTPIIARLPRGNLRERWIATAPRGEIRDLTYSVDARRADAFEIEGQFSEIGFEGSGALAALTGLSGTLRADARGGSIRLSGSRTTIAAPGLVERPLVLDDLDGLVLWRHGRSADRIVTDDLAFEFLGAPVDTSFDLSIPRDGTSARLDLESQIGALDVAAIKPYAVAAQPRQVVAQWLDRAVGGGRIEGARVSFFGPIEAFPFVADEGQFRVVANVRGGILDYVEGWPRAEAFDGEIEFLNAGFAARGRARVLGNASENVEVTIDNVVRDSTLRLAADTSGPLADLLQFLLEAPLIADYLGPGYSQLSAPAGVANVRLDLSMPLPVTSGYDLAAELEIVDGTLAYAGFRPEASDIHGRLRLDDGRVTGRDIAASFLDGPVDAQVIVPERSDYRSEILVEGEVSADAVLAAFSLPYREQLAGQTRWRGRLSLPDIAAAGGELASPVLVEADANLSGIALRFPEPFAKAPRDATNLHLEFSFDAGGDLAVSGNLGANRHFTGLFAKRGDARQFLRGRLSLGEAATAPLPASGLEIVGTAADLDFDAWRNLLESTDVTPRPGYVRSVDLEIADLKAFGQVLGATSLEMDFSGTSAALALESDVAAGRITIPLATGRGRIAAQLDRLYLQTSGATGGGAIDPRRLPGLEVAIEDFRVGARRLGRFAASVEPDPLGLRVTSFTSESGGFRAEGSGAWLAGERGSESRLAFSLSSADVATALGELGFDPVIEGQAATLTASLHWPGGPSADWMSHLGGDIALRVDEGSMLDIEPGAGRIVGLMSIVALPRRLALDFRDVFNRGFAFDEITADFKIVDGNAYTDNLMLSGPAAEIGVVGRTGLRDRDFHQQAVVTAEPSNMLPTVGGLIGGPGVGAALLIFTRIFKKPLRGLGRVSYCITGDWDEPNVERLTAEQLEGSELCAELPPQWASEALVEGAP